MNEILYSKQLYVYDEEFQNKISETNVLISGIGGLGIEIAKNLILSGVNSIMLHDICDTSIYDLSSQYLLTSNDLKKNRAVMSRDKLANLNENVSVYVSTIDLSEDLVKYYDLVILTDSTLVEQIDLNNYCRKNNIKFISTITRGLIGKIFCDFGNKFLVEDLHGDEINKSYINYIKDNIIVCSEHTEHGILKEGKIRIFNIPNIDNEVEYRVREINKTTLEVLDKIDNSVNLGYLLKVKDKLEINFKSLEESLKNPDFEVKNEDNFDIFYGLLSLNKFFEDNGRLTRPWFEEDAIELFEISKSYYKNSNEKIIKNISYTAKGEICAIQSIIGSIVAQEGLKSVTNKFKPITQWFCYNALDCLTSHIKDEDITNILKKNERYSSQIIIFGKELQEKIFNNTILLVGCGNLSSEFMKNYSMMGLGNIILTDSNIIKEKDLLKNICFKKEDLNNSKSEIMTKYFKSINKKLNIKNLKHNLKKNYESTFNDNFYKKLNIITNSVSNYGIKSYLKDISMIYNIPYLEISNNGLQSSLDVIIPKITEIFKENEIVEENLPLCIINNFPFKINHTVIYSKKIFYEIFIEGPRVLKKYMEGNINNLNIKEKNLLLSSFNDLVKNKSKNFEDCIIWALNLFTKHHRNKILQLKYNFPKDSKNKNGQYFWTGIKKLPKEIFFNLENNNHLKFILYFSNVRADLFKINRCLDILKIKDFLKNYKIPEFIPNKNLFINTDLNKKEENYDYNFRIPIISINDIEDIQNLNLDFDNSSNFHLECIAYMSNARAVNYEINVEKNYKIKKILKNIKPFLITTTSLLAGLGTIEIYKIINNQKSIDKFRNSKINLGNNFIEFKTPNKPEIMRYDNNKFTAWSNFEVNKRITLKNLLLYFKEKYKLDLNMIVYETLIIYSFFTNEEKIKERMCMNIETIIKKMDCKNKKKTYKLTISSYKYENLPDIIYRI